jgi:hypothetical protein
MHAATRRHSLAVAVAIALALAGTACSQRAADTAPEKAAMLAQDAVASATVAEAPPPAPMRVARGRSDAGAAEVQGMANHNGSQLAYAHDVRVRMPGEGIANAIAKVRDACNAQSFGPCDVLGEQMSAGDIPNGELQMRAAPAAVAGLVKAAAEGGTIAQRSTQAEDLAAAVRDNGLRRKRLELQHEKLTEILAKGHGDMDQLVALTERLAELEAELGSAEQEAAQQQRRITTNLLSLHFEAENVSVATVASTRIGDALRGLTGTWDAIIAWVISALLGVLLPFGLVFGAAAWLALKLLRLRRPKSA